MARNYPANTQIQKFLEESYNKERDARLAWYLKLSRGEQGSQVVGKSKQYEVFRRKIENAPKIAEDMGKRLPRLQPKQFHKKRTNVDDNLVKLAADKPDSMLVEMRPVTPKTKKLLYHGFSKEGTGRYLYLQNRYKTFIPEQKYEFPITSSWEYGWRLGDVIQKEDIKKPKAGRTRIVADTFYTRTGIPAIGTAFS